MVVIPLFSLITINKPSPLITPYFLHFQVCVTSLNVLTSQILNIFIISSWIRISMFIILSYRSSSSFKNQYLNTPLTVERNWIYQRINVLRLAIIQKNLFRRSKMSDMCAYFVNWLSFKLSLTSWKSLMTISVVHLPFFELKQPSLIKSIFNLVSQASVVTNSKLLPPTTFLASLTSV